MSGFPAGREAHTAASFHVWPKLTGFDWRTRPAPPRLEIALSTDSVNPGDSLEAVVRAPDAWNGAAGTLVLARGGIREQKPFVLADGATRFTFPVDDSWAPSVAFQAFIVTPPTGSNFAHPRVEEATAAVQLPVAHRYLRVQVDAPPKAGPGETVELAVHVRDQEDQPVAARVALWAVDEAVLDLTNYEVPDLLPDFVPRRGAELADFNDLRSILYPFTPTPDDPWFDPTSYGLGGVGRGGGGSGYGSGGGAGYGGRGGRGGPPPPRSRFEATPVFLA